MRFIALISIVFLFLTSCKEKSEYPGFSVTETGLNYKIHTIGDSKSNLVDSQMIWLNYEIADLNNSAIHAKSDTHILFRKNISDSGMLEFLNLLVIGDSASLIQVDEFNKKRSINILIKGQSSFMEWKFYSEYGSFFELNQIINSEANKLQSMLNQFEKDSIDVYNGVFLIQEVAGTGEYPITDDIAIFHFEGFTSEGKLFDSTRKRNEPFSYKLGEQGQVIKGLDFAIRRMKKGEKATVIIPSILAFGSNGSSDGLLKPNQPLIYNIEVLDINSSL